MSVFARAGSPRWWLWLETAPTGKKREKTEFLIGTTVSQRNDSRKKAEDLYYQRMNEIATGKHHMPVAPVAPAAVETFAIFAPWYDAHHIDRHGGKEREREILKRLRLFFDPYPLDQITKALVIAWRTSRLATGLTVHHFGGAVDDGPAMWRQIHTLLTDKGPMPLADIRARFKLSTRDVCRTFLTAATRPYFHRQGRGIWAAQGKPHDRKTHTFKPPTARTVNREVDLLQQILSAAVEAGKIAASPIYGLANLPIVEPIRRTMSEDEERAVLAHLEPDDAAIFITGTDTLARMIDILDLQWADDHGASLDIRDPKNGLSHTVPISTRLRRLLDALPKDGLYVFPRRRKAASAAGRRSRMAKVLKRACERAGVPYGRALRGLTWHWSTRRTGATRMIRRGGERAVSVVQQIGGWKDANVLIGIYQETITAEMIAAVETVAPITPPESRKGRTRRRPKAVPVTGEFL